MNDIESLIQNHKRLIESEASKWAKFIPKPVVEAEAYKLAYKAARSFKPSLGLQFSTHLTHQLKKLSRISTKYGGIIRPSEEKQFKLHKINQIEQELRDDLGREPTIRELADATGMGITAVNNILKLRKKEVNINNLAYTPTWVEGPNDEWVQFVYHDLPEIDRLIFEYKTGFGNKPVLTNEELAKKLKLSQSTITSRLKMISDKLAEGWKYGY